MRLTFIGLILFAALLSPCTAKEHVLKVDKNFDFAAIENPLSPQAILSGHGLFSLKKNLPPGGSMKTATIYPEHIQKTTEAYSAGKEIVFSRVETGHYPNAELVHLTDFEGRTYFDFLNHAGQVRTRVLKNNGFLTSEAEWSKRYYLAPENFENGASMWLFAGELENFSIEDVVREIKEEGKFTVRLRDFQNVYEYTAYSIYANKLTGELKVISDKDVPGSTRIVRLKENGPNLLFFLTENYDFVKDIQYVDTYRFYMESLPNIPTNLDSVAEKVTAYMQSSLNLPAPLFVVFTWSYFIGEDHQDYHKALVEVRAIKMKNGTTRTFAVVSAQSDTYILHRRLREFEGTYMIQSAKYIDPPHNLESIEVYAGEAFGFLDEDLSPTGPILIGYFHQEPSPLPYAGKNYCAADFAKSAR